MVLAFLFTAVTVHAARVEIREGQFYVDGQPFYARGIGYAPWRPHQHPGVSYVNTNRRWTKMDFARMKAARFNTIRTWDALDAEELALARDENLMVLQGIWLDPKQDFSDPHNQQSGVAIVEGVASYSKDFDNVLGYVLMTEPSPGAILETGVTESLQYFRRLKRSIQTIDPRPVSMDSWPPLAFMDHQDFDFAMFNVFAFWPASLTHSLGHAGLVRWLADRYAADRPLVIGETGGFAVSQASHTAAGGFGGLTEYNQSLRDLESLRSTIEGHASGSILVSWIDTWHYPRDPDTHDNEPWEWNGVLGIATDSAKDMKGVPRQVYRDVGVYNYVIPIEPKANHFYPADQVLRIRAYGAPGVASVRYSLNHGDWTRLQGSRDGQDRKIANDNGWFYGSFKLPKLARKRQTLSFQALDDGDTELAVKEVSFIAQLEPEHVSVRAKANEGKTQTLEFIAEVKDSAGQPIGLRKVDYGCFYAVSFRESMGTLSTTANGQVSFRCPPPANSKDRRLFVAAGTDSPERVRTGDIQIFALKQ